MRPDVIVIGAGVCGLTCARGLADRGATVLVLDRAKGVGGRCATRHVDGLAIDFGVVFLHGADSRFLGAVASVPDVTVLDWPRRRHDTGTPCQPDAFVPSERRLAYVEGVSSFPKHLARGLTVELRTEVTTLSLGDGVMKVATAGGPGHEAPTVVVALAPEQARELLTTLASPSVELAAANELLDLVASVRSMTLLCGYPRWSPEPAWDVSYPSDSPVLGLISNESSKRPERLQNVVVYQATPRWSRAHFEDPQPELQQAMLGEATHRLGSWAGEPAWAQVHRWRYARLDRGNELSSPLCVTLEGGARLGIAGEIFSPGGGVEAAWVSGTRLAERLAGTEQRA